MSITVSAQITISGEQSVVMGDSATYYLSPTSAIAYTIWSATGGSVISSNNYSATIEWYNSPSSGAVFAEVHATNNVTHEKSLAVTVSVPNPSISFSVSSGCGLKTISYTASPPSGITWYWQTAANGQLTNNPTKVYSNIGTSGYYFVRARYGTTWSTGAAQTPYVDVVSPPAPPLVNHNNPNWNTRCDYTMIVTNPQAGYTYNWYESETGGVAVHTGTSLTVNQLSPGYYPRWVESHNGQCASNIRTTINFTVSDIPGPPVTDKFGYPNCEITLSVSPQYQHNYKWYTSPTGGNPQFIGASYVTNFPVAGAYDFYVSDVYPNGCEGFQRTKTTVNIYPLLISSSSAFVNQAMSLNIVDPQVGYDYIWYDEVGAQRGIGNSFNPPTNQAGTFNYKAKACDGANAFATTTVYIYDRPEILSSTAANNNTVYVGPGETITLSSSVNLSQYSWRRNGTEVGSGPTFKATQLGQYTLFGQKTDANGTIGISSPELNLIEGLSNLNMNYIETNDIQSSGIFTNTQLDVLPIGYRQQSIQYFDGLGRPIQSVTTGNSPERKDIVQPIIYDQFGREALKYLPSVVQEGNGRFKSDLVNETGIYNTEIFSNGLGDKIEDDTHPFAKTLFEPSPLNRPLKQGAAGVIWQPIDNNANNLNDKTLKMRYKSNGVAEVILFDYDITTNTVSSGTSGILDYYDAGELYANATYDENNNLVIEYIDKERKTVCKKVQYAGDLANPQFASTYYIYDDFGNLVVVLPPEAINSAISQLTRN